MLLLRFDMVLGVKQRIQHTLRELGLVLPALSEERVRQIRRARPRPSMHVPVWHSVTCVCVECIITDEMYLSHEGGWMIGTFGVYEYGEPGWIGYRPHRYPLFGGE